MNLEDLIVEVRDKFLNRIGKIDSGDLDFTYEGVFNNVGTWKMTLPSEHPMAFQLRIPGSGIIITNPKAEAPWDTVMSGPVTAPELAITPEDTAGSITYEGVDDNILLADRLIVPFAQNNPPEEEGAHYVLSDGFRIENVMRFLVGDHASEFAWPQTSGSDRRNGLFDSPPLLAENNFDVTPTKRLAIGEPIGTGSGLLKWRYDNLGKVLSDLGSAYGIGFRVVQVGARYQFQSYAPADKTKDIRLDVLNNTLDGQRIKTEAPKLTRAYVAGQGDLADRTLFEYTSMNAELSEEGWNRRIEVFIDQRQTDDEAQLQKAAQEAFTDGGGEAVTVQAIPNENSKMEYGVDWHLGEQVTVVADGYEYTVYVVGVILKVDSSGGLVCGVKLGSEYRAKGDDRTNALMTLSSRVSNLEAHTPAAKNDSAWTDANLLGVWANYGAPYDPPGHRIVNGVVYLRGMAKNGSGNAFRLPVGARPNSDLIVPGVAYAVSGASTTGGIGCRIAIGADGYVTPAGSVNNTWVSFAGISFPAEK